nr:MAG TPA: putative head-tail connector protein [Caudoviricetes sp.]
MALVVEDGTGKSDADSYVSLESARALAAKYGLSLPEQDAAAEAALRNGAVYIGLQEPTMCGRRVSATQSLSFPRTGIRLHGFHVASNIIPAQVVQAQIIAAVEYGKGTDVRGTTDGRAVASERVEGAVAVSYFNNGNNGSTVVITAAMDALRALLCGDTSGFSFNVFRG